MIRAVGAASSRSTGGRRSQGLERRCLRVAVDDPRPRRIVHTLAEIETRMWRLVVTNVLPRDRQTVLRIVHERVDSIRPGMVVE